MDPGRRLIDRLTIWVVLVVALAAGCSGDGLQPQDGLHLHLRWSVMLNDQPSTCAAARVARVAVHDTWTITEELGSWPCELLEGTTGVLSTTRDDLGIAGAMLLFAPAFDADGVRLSTGGFPSGEVRFPDAVRGVVDLPDQVLLVTDEPLAELRRLFSAASAYYQAHGQLPPSTGGTSTPFPVGYCCASRVGACTPDPKLWAGSPWKELGFSIDHSFYYVYTFTAVSMSPPTFVVEADADLLCDGGDADYSITGTWNGTAFTGIDVVTKRIRP